MGLSQHKPKISFQQSLAKLGGLNVQKLQVEVPALVSPRPTEQVTEVNKEPEESVKLDFQENLAKMYKNQEYYDEIRQLSARLTRDESTQPKQLADNQECPPPKIISDDANTALLKLAQALQTKIDIKINSGRREEPVSLKQSPRKSKKTKERHSESSETQSGRVVVEAETILSLKNEIKEIAKGFQVLQAAIGKSKDEVPAKEEGMAEWILATGRPRSHPYTVLGAVEKKLRASERHANYQHRDAQTR